MKDKIQIKIDISNALPARETSLMSRWNYQSVPGNCREPVPGAGEFPVDNNAARNTGFRYYNFAKSSWTSKGKFDPVTDIQVNSVMFTVFDGSQNANKTFPAEFYDHILPDLKANVNAPQHRMYQFGMSPQTGYIAKNIKELKDMGYDRIGAATMAGAGPNMSALYHASEDEQLKMSDYISHPFLLEKAVLEIPVTARRQNGNFHPADVASGGFEKKVNGGNRDIDNYVFFVYRQSNPSIDTAVPGGLEQYVSGSRRNLIMSASMAFYNSNAFNASIKEELLSSGLPHTPAFSHDFNATVSGSGDPGNDVAGVITSFSGTLRIEMTPAVANGGRRSGSRFPNYSMVGGNTNASAWPTLLWQDFWLGGTDFQISRRNFSKEIYYGAQNAVGGMNNNSTAPSTNRQLAYGNTFHAMWNQGNSFHHKAPGDTELSRDQRPFRNFTGFNDEGNIQFAPGYRGEDAVGSCRGISKTATGSNSSNLSVSTPSPYLLMPDDNLVFGIDAGISCIPLSGTTGMASGLTRLDLVFDPLVPNIFGNAPLDAIGEAMSGSYMRLESGPASITLYGSMISDGKERLFELNQNLTSDSIHEALHFDNPVVDQFDIHSNHAYSGSYIDNLVFGDIRALQMPATAGTLDKMIVLGNEFFPYSLPRGVYGSLGSDSSRGIEKYYSYDSNNSTADTKGGIRLDPYGLSHWNSFAARNSQRNSLLRANKLLDKSEQWYDTIMPDIKDFAERSGFSVKGGSSEGRGLEIIGELNGLVNECPTETDPTNPGLPSDYIANKKAQPYDTRTGRSSWSLAEIKFRKDGNYSATPGGQTINTAAKNAASTFPNHVVFNTIMFGTGYKIRFQGETQDTASINFAPPYSTASVKVPNSTPWGACGFLYGIQNVRPEYSNMYFRYNKFGQFRDMLEQRRDGKFNKSSSPAREVDAPIQCVFVERENGYIEVSPYQTDSGNMSTECTSSLPFTESGLRVPRMPGLIILQRTHGKDKAGATAAQADALLHAMAQLT